MHLTMLLTQKHEDEVKPVAWAGRKISKAEVNYDTLENELAAIIFASRQWRCYLENNQPVYIHSDHNPLRFLQTQKKLTGKQGRWVESLSRINWYITYIPGDKNVVADAVSRATHLPLSQVVLHDGHTLAAEKLQEPYSALSLTTALVRRHPTQFYETTSSGYPTLVDGSGATSSGNTSAPNTARQISAEELFSAPTSENSRFTSTSPTDLQSYPVLPPLQQRQHPLPYLQAATAARPPTHITRSSQRCTIMLTAQTPEVTPPRLTRPSPSSLPPHPPTAGSSGRILTPRLENGTLPSEETDGMIADQPVSHYIDPEALKEVGTGLCSQAHQHLNLDIEIDQFWERLRAGHAHDPAFKSPRTKYRFDRHLQVHFFYHRLVTPDHDCLRKNSSCGIMNTHGMRT